MYTLFSGGSTIGEYDSQCGMYLIPSTIPGAGRGVVAGVNFSPLDSIEIVSTLSANTNIMDACQLKNYGFSTGYDNYAMIIFGPGNIYNHRDSQNIDRFWAYDDNRDVAYSTEPFADFNRIHYRVNSSILLGEEMFETYGPTWFSRFTNTTGTSDVTVSETDTVIREEQQPQPTRMDLEDLQQHGHCLTDVRIKQSHINGAGKGLFAMKDYLPGEVVTISPVLTLPKHIVDESISDSVLMNYCYAISNSNIVLFPLNYGPLINYNTTTTANVDIVWYDWNPSIQALSNKYNPESSNSSPSFIIQELSLEEKLNISLEELLSSSFAPLDIAYIATRYIEAGEEIYYNYGEQWEIAWNNYQSQVLSWKHPNGPNKKLADKFSRRRGEYLSKSTGSSKSSYNKPKFHHYISISDELYPDHWKLSQNNNNKYNEL